MQKFSEGGQQSHRLTPECVCTVAAISVWTNPILCTKSPKFTMLFYYIKMQTSSSPCHPFLQLTGALKWGAAWTSISTGVDTTHGQS